MPEPVIAILLTLLGSAAIGTNIGLWLKLIAERQIIKSENARLSLEISERNETRADNKDDRWRELYAASNLQWQNHAQQQLLSAQSAGDRQVQELSEGIKQARRDLEIKTHESIEAAAKSIQIIAALEAKVTTLEQTLVALRHEIKVLTEQNTQLIKRKDVSPAEQETLSAEVEASQTVNIEENNNAA